MKKNNNIKKEVKKIKKTEDSKVNKRKKQTEPDLWKEIRSNLKPLGKAYNKFKEKRRIVKQKEEERRLKENEKQRLLEEEALRLQEQEERRLKKEKKIKEEEERKLRSQEEQRLKEKRIKEERQKRIRQEQIYQERLIKGEQERVKQLERVNKLREEEKQLIEERRLKVQNRITEEQKLKNEEEQKLKEEEEKRLIAQHGITEEQKLKNEEEQKLKEEEERRSEEKQTKKRLNGKVKWFNSSRGYGFIQGDDVEKDIFVHYSAVQKAGIKYLKEGDQLTFEIEYSDRGSSAINLLKTIQEVSRAHLKVIK